MTHAALVIAAALLLALTSAARPARAMLLSPGVECACTVTVDADDPLDSMPRTTITARCETGDHDAGFGDGAKWPATCPCASGVVATCVRNPTEANQGVASLVERTVPSTTCHLTPCAGQSIANGVNTTCLDDQPCSGSSGCPDAALKVDVAEFIQPEANGDVACGRVTSYADCTKGDAPCHCVFHEDASACAPNPGNPCRCTTTYTTVIDQPSNGVGGATTCPPDGDTRTVTTVLPCDRDCVVGPFSAWSTCSGGCGGPGSGTQTRSRDVLVTPRGNGAACPVLSESRACDLPFCTCAVSEWVGECELTCGTGNYTQTRTITSGHAPGQCAEELTQVLPCVGLPLCNADCVHGNWTAWSACSSTCGAPGSSTRTRIRAVLEEPVGTGVVCGAITDTEACDVPLCPVDCVVGGWSAWTNCSEPCDAGTESRTRNVVVAPVGTGAPCPALTETRACSLGVCDCTLSDWSEWSQCSVPCGGGTRERVRSIAAPGATCASTSETEACNEEACPVDCAVGDWSVWSDCLDQCGAANTTQQRSRSVTAMPQGAGLGCPPTAEQRPCARDACPAANCEMGAYRDLGCSQPCGGGVRVRVRQVTAFGPSCGSRVEQTACAPEACLLPTGVNCTTGEWSAWSACEADGGNRTCGLGTRWRNRTLSEGCAVVAGLSEREEVPCDTGVVCPHDCLQTEWSAWSTCTATCGGTGTQYRTRHTTQHPVGTGAEACGASYEERHCNYQPCPEYCEYSGWSPWSPCSASCNTGFQERGRAVTRTPKNGAGDCEPTTDHRLCNEHQCAAPSGDCTFSAWGSWGPCSASCGLGTQSRTRTLTAAATDGSQCPGAPLSQTRACNTHACPVDCAQTTPTDWGNCTQPCGEGHQTRQFPIIGDGAVGQGQQCGDPLDTRACNTEACGDHRMAYTPQDCEVGAFSAFPACGDTDCHVNRTRVVVQAADPDGRACPPLVEYQECENRTACLAVQPTVPVDPTPSGSDDNDLETIGIIAGASVGGVAVVGGLSYLIYSKCASQSGYSTV